MFKIVWDKKNNGVRLTMSCADEALNVCPRPVFYEELDLLGLDKLGWKYPHSKEPLLWACERRYFCNGELVFELQGGDISSKPSILNAKKNITLSPISLEKLTEVNEDQMFLLEHEAMDFIFNEYSKYVDFTRISKNNPNVDFQQLAKNLEKKHNNKYVVVKENCESFDIMPLSEAESQGKPIALKSNIDIFVVSFSGGKDSQVILDLVSRVLPSSDFVVIYSDTGYELPPSITLYNEVTTFYKGKYPDLQFYISRNEQPLMFYWDKLGSPSRMHRWCCSVMKSAPLTRLLKTITGKEKQPHAILFDGVRAEESNNRANRERIGYNVKHNNVINISPILEWNATEIYLYILMHGLPINQAYRRGFSRVGCVICPYSSKWSEFLATNIYPDSIKPFITHVRNSCIANKISGVDNYICEGKWKERAGGRGIDCETQVIILEEDIDFRAVLTNPREDLLIWLTVIGDFKVEFKDNVLIGQLNHRKQVHKFSVTNLKNGEIEIYVKDVNKDVVLLSHLKKVVYKATYCIHCEVCEVNCPTGALTVTPTVSIDKAKCVHCLKCIDFDGKGCVSASSVSISTGEKKNKSTSMKSGINRYNDGMGLREVWLKKYFETHETFFNNDSHGLNPRYQIPPFINWIREAGILNETNKTITATGLKLKNVFAQNKNIVWEIIFINLCYNSEICKWFFSAVDYNKEYTKQELEIMIQNDFPDFKDRTLKNPLNSLLNTFKESPLGRELPIAKVVSKDKKVGIIRLPHNDLSLAAVAYSLYKYAEQTGRYDLTVSEFYNNEQKDGIYKQFGIDQDVLEQSLRSLEMDNNHVLRAELTMGLDNIILQKELSAEDVLQMLI